MSADLIARQLGLERSVGVLCLACLGAFVISVRLGWRQALLGLAGLALLTIPVVLSQADPITLTLLMSFTASVVGVSARWQLQQAYWLLVVSLCLLITNSPFTVPPSSADLIRLVGGLLLSGGLTVLLQAKLIPPLTGGGATAPFPVVHSWRRSAAYGLLLASTTWVSIPVAVHEHWHITGLWLILTPFLVLRPFVRDAWSVALHRSLGTVAGVLLVMLLALLLPKALPLQVPAIVLAVLSALIAMRRGHPALMLMVLTITVVLFNSNHADLIQMADRRLQASGLGVVLALTVMAIAHPIERQLAIRSLRGTS